MRGLTPLAVVGGSVVVLGLLAAALWWHDRPATADPLAPPLIVYAAASTRPPMEAVAADYRRDTDRAVELRFGASEDILTRAALPSPTEPADLLLPADDSYVRMARARNLVGDALPLARMRAVVLTGRGNPKQIAAWDDLLKDGVRVAVPSPAAAVGKLSRDHLMKTGQWAALAPHTVDAATVTDAANAAKAGGVDAAIVWDAVATNYTDQTTLVLPELDGVVARLEVAVLAQSRDPAAALAFAQYLADPQRGLRHFLDRGFHPIGPGEPR